MSLKCIDDAVKKKLEDVFPNVVFGSLQDALKIDADRENQLADPQTPGFTVQDENVDDFNIVDGGKTYNELATKEYTKTYSKGEEDKFKGTVALPLIAVDRLNNPFAFDYQANDPLARRGWYLEQREGHEHAFAITPVYQIDIISDRRNEVDDIWRELVMYLYLHNELSVIYSPGTEKEFEERFPIKLIDTDNTTDVSTFDDLGRLYRQTITFEVTNAKLLYDEEAKVIESIPVRIINLNKEDDYE